MIVDYARVCRLNRAKFWQDSDETLPIRWYRVPNTTPAVPFPHAFGIRDFDFDKKFPENPTPGTAGVFAKPYTYDKGARPVLWQGGGSVCGPMSAWQDGGLTGVDTPLTWTTWEFSTCCLLKMLFPQFFIDGIASYSVSGSMNSGGRVALSGSADVVGHLTFAASGDIALTGLADTPAVYLDTHGGFTLTGSAGASVVGHVSWLASGGIALTGVASVASSVYLDASGSMQITGVAAVLAGMSLDASGSMQITGVADVLAGMSLDASGGVSLDGVASVAAGMSWDGSGDIALTGLADMVDAMSWYASGGVTLDGVASLSGSMSFAASGGFALTGTARVAAGMSHRASGAISLTGVAYLYNAMYWTWNGGWNVSGEAEASSNAFYWVGSGDIVLTGHAALSEFVSLGSGSFTITGVADASQSGGGGGWNCIMVSGSPQLDKYDANLPINALNGASVTGAGVPPGTTVIVVNPIFQSVILSANCTESHNPGNVTFS